jgi:hypothetical protein
MFTFPFLLIYRATVACIPRSLTFRHTVQSDPFDVQLSNSRYKNGGWYTSPSSKYISTRETFFIVMALRLQNRDIEYAAEYVVLLSKYMSSEGQVPWRFSESWSGNIVADYDNNGVPVVDANAQFIIMVSWLYESKPALLKKLYLHTRRAFEWLETFVKEDSFYEPPGASWESSRKHDGYLLTSNVFFCQTIRALELICINQRDTVQQNELADYHTRFKTKIQTELYTTQEVLPRILAVYWNIVPGNFWRSFNQELHYPIPLILSGPVAPETTWEAWMYGIDDQHTTLIYPWLGFLWIALLCQRHQTETASDWWKLYDEFHSKMSLYDIYSPDNLLPICRAFVKSQESHSLTLAMYQAASHGLLSQRHLQYQDV